MVEAVHASSCRGMAILEGENEVHGDEHHARERRQADDHVGVDVRPLVLLGGAVGVGARLALDQVEVGQADGAAHDEEDGLGEDVHLDEDDAAEVDVNEGAVLAFELG